MVSKIFRYTVLDVSVFVFLYWQLVRGLVICIDLCTSEHKVNRSNENYPGIVDINTKEAFNYIAIKKVTFSQISNDLKIFSFFLRLLHITAWSFSKYTFQYKCHNLFIFLWKWSKPESFYQLNYFDCNIFVFICDY